MLEGVGGLPYEAALARAQHGGEADSESEPETTRDAEPVGVGAGTGAIPSVREGER